jgi:hypothetical protein
MSLAEEREFVKRYGPDSVRAIIDGRNGWPTRMCRATVLDADWTTGLLTIREVGDTGVKTDVPWLPPYTPILGDLVWYQKFGDDGIVLGTTVRDDIESAVVGGEKAAEATVVTTSTTASATFVTPTGGPSLPCWAFAGEPIEVRVEAMFFIDAAGTNGAVFSWRATGPATEGDIDENGCESGVFPNTGEWHPGSRTTLWHPTASGQYTLEFRTRRIGSGTGNFKHRRIAFERVSGYAP